MQNAPMSGRNFLLLHFAVRGIVVLVKEICLNWRDEVEVFEGFFFKAWYFSRQELWASVYQSEYLV